MPAPPGALLGAGDEPLDALVAADGTTLYFVATKDGVTRLWRRTLATGTDGALDGTEGAMWPSWIEPGRRLSFFTPGSLKALHIDTGQVTQVVALQGAAGATWPGDGSVLLGHQRGPIDRWADGRATRVTTLRDGDVGHRFPAVVDATSWLYLAERTDGRRIVRLVRGGAERDLTGADGHAVVEAGWLLYPRGGALLAQRFDADAGQLSGRAVAVATHVGVSSDGRTRASASVRVLLVAPPGSRRVAVRWFGLDGAPHEAASEPGEFWQVRASPDGRRLAVTMPEPLLRTLDVYTLRAGSSVPEPVTLGLAADSDPVWSPDGRSLAYRAVRSGQDQVSVRRVGVTGAPEEPVAGGDEPARGTPTDWRPGLDTLIVARAPAPGAPSDLVVVDPASGHGTPLVATAFHETDARYSPDGRRLAYVSDESGQPEVYVRVLANGTRTRVSQAGGSRPRWSDTALFFVRGDGEVMRADVRPGDAPEFAVPVRVLVRPGLRDFDVSRSRQALVAIVPTETTATVPIGAVVNWPSIASSTVTE